MNRSSHSKRMSMGLEGDVDGFSFLAELVETSLQAIDTMLLTLLARG